MSTLLNENIINLVKHLIPPIRDREDTGSKKPKNL